MVVELLWGQKFNSDIVVVFIMSEPIWKTAPRINLRWKLDSSLDHKQERNKVTDFWAKYPVAVTVPPSWLWTSLRPHRLQLRKVDEQPFCELFTLTGPLLVSGRTGRCSRRKEQTGRAKPSLPNMVHSCHGATNLPLPLSPLPSSPLRLPSTLHPPPTSTPFWCSHALCARSRAHTRLHARTPPNHTHTHTHTHTSLHEREVCVLLFFRTVVCLTVCRWEGIPKAGCDTLKFVNAGIRETQTFQSQKER